MRYDYCNCYILVNDCYYRFRVRLNFHGPFMQIVFIFLSQVNENFHGPFWQKNILISLTVTRYMDIFINPPCKSKSSFWITVTWALSVKNFWISLNVSLRVRGNFQESFLTLSAKHLWGFPQCTVETTFSSFFLS